MADSAFSFKDLNLPRAPTEPTIFGDPLEKSGPCHGENNSYLLSWREYGWKARKERAENNEYSVSNARASCYLPGCFMYNCCFPCLSRWLGPCWGDRFCCNWGILLEVKKRRAWWLWWQHVICCIFHTLLAVLSFWLGHGKPMGVSIYRVKPNWENTGASGYSYTVEEDFQIRIDVVTGLFFALSAFFHGIWVIFGGCKLANWFLWRNIDRCICYLRWVEYSLSASLMLTAIGLISGLREEYAMLCVFMLCHVTMLCGLMTEMLSRPDLCYEKWDGDPVPLEQLNFEYVYKKLISYCWRISPHLIGWFPYLTAWFVTLSNFFRQIWDLPQDLRDRIPPFVVPAIAGTFVIFSSFSFVQLRYQWVAPKHYWRSEMWLNFLSLTAKAFLGLLLIFNVITAASFDEALALTNSSST